MSKTIHSQITNNHANAGSGAAGIGLGTALLVLALSFTSDLNIIKVLQYGSPTISVAGAFLIKFIYNYFESKHRLGKIAGATKHIEGLMKAEDTSPAFRKMLTNRKEKLHMEELEIMTNGLFNEKEGSNIPNQSLKRNR